MLTNPSTSSTSVSSSSLVEASSLSSPSSTATPTSVGNATPNRKNATKPKTPAKRRKKDNTDVELVVPIAVESSSAVVNDNSKKRSRKQKIDTFRNEYDVPILEGLSASDKSAKRKKGGRKSSDKNVSSSPRVKKEGNNVKKNNVTKSKSSTASASSQLSKKSKKGTSTKKTATTTTTTATAAPPPDDDSVVSYGPQSKIVLKKSEFIDPNLSFTIFSDLTRGLGAIGPSQVILAVESTREPGSKEAFFKDLSDSDSRSAKKPIVGQFQLFDLLLSVPHFLPLTSVYSSGEPFARILRFSALEQYTNGVLGKNQVSTFRFYGPRYEKQVPALPAAQEKAASVTPARDPNSYLDSVLIIKHPILGFYSRKLVSLKFVVLKKVGIDSCVVGHLKAKVVQLRRSADLKNIEIYVDESRVPEAASDVSAMNQQNIQPVIQTPSGLVPVITRTAYQPQQEYTIHPQQELAETQFQYVHYNYQTATELVQDLGSNSVGGSNNFIVSLDNAGLIFDGAQTFRDETGAPVLILSPSGDDLSSNYVQQHQPPTHPQQIIHQLQSDHGSYFQGQEQSVIIQQHPQQQTYAIQQQQAQQQHQQSSIVQVQQSQQAKEVTRQLVYLPGTSGPIEFQFIPSEPSQQEDSNRHYNQQAQPIQLQVQTPPGQYRPGQQLVVHQNQFQIQQQQQAIQQHVINSQGQVVRQQQFIQQNSTSSTSSAQSFQYRATTPQQSQQIVHHTSQQQHHQIPAPVSNQSVAIQQGHQVHSGNQVSTIQALPSSSQQVVRFQSSQQQQLQQAQLQVQQVPRPQLIQQTVSVPQAQQSPQKAAPAPSQVPAYQQQQRPQYQQQVQQQFPQGGTPYIPPATTPQSTAPTSTTTPSTKQKGTKTKQKKNAKGGNLNQASTNLDDQYLSPQQLEQLRQRENKSLAYQPQQLTPPPPPVPSQQSFRPATPPTSYSAPPQGGARLQSPGARPKGRGPRPPAPPPPIISSSAAAASLARLPSVSSGTSARLPVAPNSHSASSTSSALAVVPKPVKKTFYVVNPNSNTTSSPSAASGPGNAVTHVPIVKTKPGYLALCPHCGVGNINIVRCQRCKVEFPADVKLIQDEWKVNRAGAVVAVASKTGSPRTTTPSPPTTSDNNKNSKVSVTSSSVANSANNKVTGKTSAAGKKIVLVNKPNILESSAVIGKTVVTPGTVQVRIQPDGGSAVTITNSGTSVVQTKIATPVTKPPVRKRPTQRKKLECITLSSDDEEPEPKVPKQEEKPSTSTTTASNTSAPSTATTSTTAATTASSTTSAATVTTTSSVAPSASTSGLVGGSQSLAGTSNQVPSDKKGVVEATTSTTAPPAEADMSKKKGLQINLTPQKDQPPAKQESSLDPNEVYEKIDSEMSEVGNKFQYTQLEIRSIRVGSYKVTSSDVGHKIAIQCTELGFKLTLPCANFKRKIAKICIPIDSIIEMKACFSRRLNVLFITTGPKYAVWIRQNLGMDGCAGNESSNYYCPLNGLPCQRTITILAEEDVSEADIGLVKKMFKDVLVELDSKQANDLLMKISPQAFKCSIGMNPENSPPEPTGSPGDRRMPLPPAPGSSLSTVSQATTVLVNSPNTQAAQEQSTPTISSSAGSSANAVQDPDKVVLSYEGPSSNKVAISPNDIKGLGYSQFLNDQIIDFWLAVIQMEMLSAEDKQKTFVFDSFFYKKLTEKIKRRQEEDGNMTAGERRHARVKKRTKNVDIFSKDFLIVPINENYHWFIAIICFPGLEGYHDYDSLEALPNYKLPKTTNNSRKSSASTSNNNKKPIVYNQPKSETTSSYSSRDEAPEDSEEMEQMSSPDTPGTDGSEPKSQWKTESGGESSNEKGSTPSRGVKRKSEFGQAVKHPCILIFDSLAGDARGRIYSTLREYLRIEYKTKKNAERTFDKNAMPGIMPKVPQQPNFSDCGLFLLQYVESFFKDPIQNYNPKEINLKNWFTPASIAQNKRREIYDFILNKVREKSPHNESRIPTVSFEPDENDLMNEDEAFFRNSAGYEDSDSDEEFEDDSDEESYKPKTSRQPSNNRQPSTSSSSSSSNKKGSDSDDHNYATTPPKPGSMTAVPQVANTNTVVVAITPLPAPSDTTLNNKNT